MHDLAIILLQLITTAIRLLRPGGARSIIAESLPGRHPLLILNRYRQRGPNLTSDRDRGCQNEFILNFRFPVALAHKR